MKAIIEGINPTLNDMVNNGQLSGTKLLNLLELKCVVDRIAVSFYASQKEVLELEARFGEKPDIISWGDYFQTEIASRYFDEADLEFDKICKTIRFDLIAAVRIFQNKPDEFLQMVEREGHQVRGISQDLWTDKMSEDAHLMVLLEYFKDLELSRAVLTAEDNDWFESFVVSEEIQAG